MNYLYKNIVILKDDVDTNLEKNIKDVFLDLYNKKENLVTLVDVSDKHFELLTDKKGEESIINGIQLAIENKLISNNVKLWFWKEYNQAMCFDILDFVRQVEERERIIRENTIDLTEQIKALGDEEFKRQKEEEYRLLKKKEEAQNEV